MLLDRLALEIKDNSEIVRGDKQLGAFALIRVGSGSEKRYLLQWNEKWSMFNLIGGKVDNAKGDANSFVYALRRELEEEMGLERFVDFRILRLLKMAYMQQHSQHEDRVKNYHFGVYEVELFPNLGILGSEPNYAAKWLSTKHENVFVSVQEIDNLKTADGRAISYTTKHILQILGEMPSR